MYILFNGIVCIKLRFCFLNEGIWLNCVVCVCSMPSMRIVFDFIIGRNFIGLFQFQLLNVSFFLVSSSLQYEFGGMKRVLFWCYCCKKHAGNSDRKSITKFFVFFCCCSIFVFPFKWKQSSNIYAMHQISKIIVKKNKFKVQFNLDDFF